jgi:diaminopimelate epimerase
MFVSFFKYQGTGNDFIMIDNRDGVYNDLSINQIQFLCNRKFGVGADGLIKLNHKEGFDFEMDYYNSDGSKSFCGNGARCTTAFAHQLGLRAEEFKFDAIDGVHFSSINEDGIVSLKMKDVSSIEYVESDFYTHTGSPHFVRFVNRIETTDVFNEGKSVRYSEKYKQEGVNVNFVEQKEGFYFVRTYERGVEDETLSCGTGVTACALVIASRNGMDGQFEIPIKTLGGKLSVKATKENKRYSDVYLIGPAKFVFQGEIHV